MGEVSHPAPSGGTRTQIAKDGTAAEVRISPRASVEQIIRSIFVAVGDRVGVFEVDDMRFEPDGELLILLRPKPPRV